MKKDFPKIGFLNFIEFYDWIFKNGLLFPIHATNSYQKALNNMSFINSDVDDISQFIYQMRTLEELYTSSKTNIAEQLDKRIQLFLGSMSSFKKQIKNMYDVRSRFLHGDASLIPFHKRDYDALYDFEKTFEYKIQDAISLSLILIISTLQKMHLENRIDLIFEECLT